MTKTRSWFITIVLLAVLLRIGVALLMSGRVVELPGVQDQISYNALALRSLLVQLPWISLERRRTPT